MSVGVLHAHVNIAHSAGFRATTKSITYDTSAEYVATVAAGSAIMKRYLQTQSASCPDQKYVLSGYSKGALVLHSKFCHAIAPSAVLIIS